jgi:hypothetical protein
MGYDLKALNRKLAHTDRTFHFGAFSWGPLIAACGHLFPCLSREGQWYCAFGVDPRMPQGAQYPAILSNDGFRVTKHEAKIMARIARNLVAIQRSLPESHRGALTPSTQVSFTKADVEKMLLRSFTGDVTGAPWPQKIRDDFVDLYERFAAWADNSGGFEVW